MYVTHALLFATSAAFHVAVSPPRHAYERGHLPVMFEEVEEIDPGEVAGLRVLQYPHPLLRAENTDVQKFDYELKQLTKRMFKLMYASRGVGLAAPQVGNHVDGRADQAGAAFLVIGAVGREE